MNGITKLPARFTKVPAKMNQNCVGSSPVIERRPLTSLERVETIPSSYTRRPVTGSTFPCPLRTAGLTFLIDGAADARYATPHPRWHGRHIMPERREGPGRQIGRAHV